MRVLLTGAAGQLGRELVAAQPSALELLACGRAELDLTRLDTLAATVERLAPHVVVNAAAYTAVDRAESEPEVAFAVNAEAVGRLAAGAAAVGARLIHVSTDFVFDGLAHEPYPPTAATGPQSVYGASKLAGERAALAALPAATLVRTSWLYSSGGVNFVTKMLQLMAQREKLSVVADQLGSPTWAQPLATALWRMVERDNLAGVWHWSDAGQCSWYDFACAIQEEALERGLLGRTIPIEPVTSAEFPTAAERPAMSALDDSATRQALGIEALPWRVALGRMLDEMATKETHG